MAGRSRARALASLVAATLVTLVGALASAADPAPLASLRAEAQERALDAPAPPTLPALAHKQLSYTFEYTAARLEPNAIDAAASGSDGAAYAWFAHGALELPIVPRKWYVGAANDVASAHLPGIGNATIVGNPEIWGRGLWSSVLGLSSGGGFGIVLPIPRDLSAQDKQVLRTVRVVRPWDVAYFNDLTLTFRPWFDIRHLTGRLIFQLRQGIDWSIAESGTDLTARATFYMGYRVLRPVGVGVEVWEVYEITRDDIEDGKRAALAISPSIRFVLPKVQPALSLLVPIATPLRGDVASYVALRLSVGFNFDYPTQALGAEPP